MVGDLHDLKVLLLLLHLSINIRTGSTKAASQPPPTPLRPSTPSPSCSPPTGTRLHPVPLSPVWPSLPTMMSLISPSPLNRTSEDGGRHPRFKVGMTIYYLKESAFYGMIGMHFVGSKKLRDCTGLSPLILISYFVRIRWHNHSSQARGPVCVHRWEKDIF